MFTTEMGQFPDKPTRSQSSCGAGQLAKTFDS